METLDEPMKFFGISYLARYLRVSNSTLYYWIKESQRGEWAHTPVPAPTAVVANSDLSGANTKVWSMEQLPEWKDWYARYRTNRWKTM